MSELQHTLEALITEMRSGSESAYRQFVFEYGPHVLRVVRRHLNNKLRRLYDSEDFQQAVWASFFAKESEESTAKDVKNVGAYLAIIARNKVLEAVRKRLQTKKTDVSRECSIKKAMDNDLICRDASASQVAIADEVKDRLLRGRPRLHQHILCLLLDGHSKEEVAKRLGLSSKTVSRLVSRLVRSEVHASDY